MDDEACRQSMWARSVALMLVIRAELVPDLQLQPAELELELALGIFVGSELESLDDIEGGSAGTGGGMDIGEGDLVSSPRSRD